MSKYVAESITMIAGRCRIVIDFAMYLLAISSPDINKVTMSLYDIINHAKMYTYSTPHLFTILLAGVFT